LLGPVTLTTIERALADCLSLDADGRGRLRLAATFQGFPETAHGGGILAALDLAGARWINATTPRTIAAQIQKTVPLEIAVPLAAHAAGPDVNLVLGDDGQPLARGRVTPSAPGPAPRWEGASPGGNGRGLPLSRGCVACGTENPLGLRIRLRFDDRWVWSEYRPPETYRTPDGRIAAALYTVLLDEMAWWLGALASGEAGVTTEISVTLHRPAHPFGARLLALGARERVAAVGERGHFWKTETVVLGSDGALLASGAIMFAGSRAYSKRLIPRLLALNPPERLRAIFPRYVP